MNESRWQEGVPLFSVVVPVHNGERFLEQALDGITAQSMPSWEAIIVDDGSTDRSLDLARTWAREQQRRATVLDPPADSCGNVAAARNRGLEAARGPWIAFLDQDDVWSPEKLTEQWLFVEQHPGVKAVGCWPEVVFESTPREQFIEDWVRVIRAVSEDEGGMLPLKHFVTGCLFCMSGVVAKKSALQQLGGFDTALRRTSDWLMWARLAVDGPLGIVPRTLVTYRMHGDNELLKLWSEGSGCLGALMEIRSRLTEWLSSERQITHDVAADRLSQLYWEAAPMWSDAAHRRVGDGC